MDVVSSERYILLINANVRLSDEKMCLNEVAGSLKFRILGAPHQLESVLSGRT
jgi:hypothetical protein